jgi:hypothetical protein
MARSGEPWQRLFFLGAGFSRPAGLPLANELLELVLVRVRRAAGIETKLDRSLEEYRDFLKGTTGSVPRRINFEDFAAYLSHEHVLGLRGSDTWSPEGNEDQLMLRWGIGAVLNELTPRAESLPSVYLEFARRLRPRDQVVTFNYDLVLERALDVVGTPYRRFPWRYDPTDPRCSVVDTERDADEVKILKVHGSLDWVNRAAFRTTYEGRHPDVPTEIALKHRREHPLFGDDPYTPVHRLVEGPRPHDDPLCDVYVLEDPDAYYSRFGNWWQAAAPLVLVPSQTKLLYGAELRDFWLGLPEYGFAWGGLNIVGYSLPPGDPYTRQVLYRIAKAYVFGRESEGWNSGPQPKIKVVGLCRSERELISFRRPYRFLAAGHTDYITDGLSQSTVEQLFECD